MKIHSFLIEPIDPDPFIVLHVVVDGQCYFVSLGVGIIEHGQLRPSVIGEGALRRLTDYADRCAGAVHRVKIPSLRQARPRVRRAFQRASMGDALFFLCPDRVVYDAVFAQLNLPRVPGLAARR
ncbi:MAG: hypothetical protein U1F76_21250 [Candidatus Competibacteraceae bacterium]